MKRLFLKPQNKNFWGRNNTQTRTDREMPTKSIYRMHSYNNKYVQPEW